MFGIRWAAPPLKTIIEMERVVIIGSSCSGKTTMARRMATVLQAPHIELDAIHWLPDWQEQNDDEFRELVSSVLVFDIP